MDCILNGNAVNLKPMEYVSETAKERYNQDVVSVPDAVASYHRVVKLSVTPLCISDTEYR